MPPRSRSRDQPRMAPSSGIIILRLSPLVIEYLNDQARLYLSEWREEAPSGLPATLMDFALDLLDLMRPPGAPPPAHPIHLHRDVATPLGVLSLRGVGLSTESSDSRLYVLIDRRSHALSSTEQRERDADHERRAL